MDLSMAGSEVNPRAERRSALVMAIWPALGGMAALALALGIERFVYTPIMPAMMEALGSTKTEAGLIASANATARNQQTAAVSLKGAQATLPPAAAGDPGRLALAFLALLKERSAMSRRGTRESGAIIVDEIEQTGLMHHTARP